MKNLNKKSKGEQLFLVMLLFTLLIGVFCIMGCGGKQSCELPQCGAEKMFDASALGCSIPGCGGCLTSGRGCNCVLWPQSCKLVGVSSGDADEDTDEKEIIRIFGCDIRYFGDGCLGCDQTEKSCYSGCMRLKDDSDNINGIFFGSSESDEILIGCANGCGGCIGSDGDGLGLIYDLEYATGVE